MSKYIMLLNLGKRAAVTYMCDQPDAQPGDVEPCAGTDTDEPSCGIAIMDTDGEWIEMKKRHNTSRQLLLQRNKSFYQRIR